MLSLELVGCLRGLAVHVPAEIRQQAGRHVADTVAIALAAAARAPEARQVIDGLTVGQTAGACHVLGTRQTLPPAYAAFANAAFAHALDCDDVHDRARVHVSSTTLPAALAAGELAGAALSDIVTAVVLGNELMCRLGLMLAPTGSGPGSDWFLTQLFGYVGAAVAAGVVLALTDEQMVAALGLAYMQMAGGKEAGLGTGSTARAIYPGFAAMGGVQAALLARAGLVGPASALDGAAGLLTAYLRFAPTDADLAALVDRRSWAFRDTAIKLWPCCRTSHPYVAAAFAARDRVRPGDVTRLRLHVSPSGAKLCRPLAPRRRPGTLQDAKFSIPFMTCFAFVHGRVDFESLTMAALGDPAVLALAERVEIVDGLEDRAGLDTAKLDIDFSGDSIEIFGSLDRLPHDTEVDHKIRSCLRYAGLGAEADRVAEILMRLEDEPLTAFLRKLPTVRVQS